MTIKYLLVLGFLTLSKLSQAQCTADCVDIQLRNSGSVLEVWLMPTTGTYTGYVSTTFTISWDAAYPINLATFTPLVPEIPIALDGTGTTVTNGGRKYNVYSASGSNNVTLTSHTPIKIMTAQLSGGGVATMGEFSINNDAYIMANNSDYFLEVGGQEVTGATSSMAMNVVLPLNLLAFTAIEQNNSAYLSWKTSNEVNFSHFEVEKSRDAKSWANIASLPKSDTSLRGTKQQNPQNTEGGYSLTDDKAFVQSNAVMYRLKMVNTDGSFSYSNIVTVHKESTKGSIKIYPNPTYNDLQVTIESPKDAVQTIEIVDIVGKIWQKTSNRLQKGYNQQKLTIQALPAGVYFLRTLDDRGLYETIKFVKL